MNLKGSVQPAAHIILEVAVTVEPLCCSLGSSLVIRRPFILYS